MKTIVTQKQVMVGGRMQTIIHTAYIREPGDAQPLPFFAVAQAYARLTPEQRLQLDATHASAALISLGKTRIGSRFD